MKYLKYYITPVLSPIIIIGILLGGHWMWLGFGELLIVMIIGDYVLGEDASKPEYNSPWLIELPLHLALPTTLVFSYFYQIIRLGRKKYDKNIIKLS